MKNFIKKELIFYILSLISGTFGFIILISFILILSILSKYEVNLLIYSVILLGSSMYFDCKQKKIIINK